MRNTYLIVAMLAISFYRIYHQFYPSESCEVKPEILLDGVRWDAGTNTPTAATFSWNACDVFSVDYHNARHKFRKASRKAGAEGASIPVVMDDGTDDSPLTTDIAILRGDLPGILVHSSATHGIEGYAGSAIQIALLTDGVLPPPEKRPTIVLVHAVNPYGMKFYRRFNENNVDLNRNAIMDFPKFLKERDPNVSGYEDFRYLTASAYKPTKWWDATFGFWFKAIPALYRYGYLSMKRSLVAGQYHHPEGVFYGGTEREVSIQGLLDFVLDKERKILAPLGKKDPVVWIDVHTGLGPFGKDTVMSEKPVSEEDMRKWFPYAYDCLTPVEDKHSGAMNGYEFTEGALTSMVFQASQKTALALTQEFGTIPGVLVARALILENMMYHYGDESGRQSLGVPWLIAAFYPQSSQWRASIVKRGVSLALQSIDYIGTH